MTSHFKWKQTFVGVCVQVWQDDILLRLKAHFCWRVCASVVRWHLTSVQSRLLLECVCTCDKMTSYFGWKQTSVGECVQGWQNHILQISWHLLRWCIHAHHFFMQVKALSLWSWARHLPSYSMPQNTPWFLWMNLVRLPLYLPPHPVCSVQWISFKTFFLCMYVCVRVCMCVCVWERERECSLWIYNSKGHCDPLNFLGINLQF